MSYLVAMVNLETAHIEPLYTGKTYNKIEALQRVNELNKNCREELKALDYDSFVVYSVGTW